VGAEITSGKMTRAEAHKRWNAVIFGVPEQVRAVLTEGQRKKLAALIGAPFAISG